MNTDPQVAGEGESLSLRPTRLLWLPPLLLVALVLPAASEAAEPGDFSAAGTSPETVGFNPTHSAVGDFDGDGEQDLATASIGSNEVTILLGDGSGNFSPAASSPETVGDGPLSVAVGDFNGDGRQDLATANVISSDVTILLGDGSGNFSPAASSPEPVGFSPRSVAVGDFNGDGKQDLATANYGSSSVTILLGDGSGDFSPSATSPEPVGVLPFSVAVGDFNGDGKQDLATANSNSDDVTILLGDGSGDFSPAASSPETVGTNPQSITVSDFDGDGKQDLATANNGSSDVTILLGDGSGDFSPAASSPETVGTNPQSVTVGDFNGDGRQDLATANFSSDNVTILLGDGSGDFSAAAGSPELVGDGPISAAVGDFNGDGRQDLATANSNASDVTILLNQSPRRAEGDFGPAASSPETVGFSPQSVAAGDFNGDGKQDLATANIGSLDVTILLGDGSGNFSAAATNPEPLGYSPYSVAVGDFNGDGKQDLATANSDSDNVTILLGDGSGNFSAAASSPEPVGGGPRSVAVGDFNGDGIQDLATANANSGNVTILLGDGSGDFSPAASSPEPAGVIPFSVAVGDFNGDGRQDLATANFVSNDVTILLGDGSGDFSPAASSPESVGANPATVVVGDFDGDGRQDLATANVNSNDVTILLGDGSGDFSPAASSPESVGANPISVTVGDFDGDGNQDLATANAGTDNVTVLLGDGSGDFSAAAGSPEPAGTDPSSVAVGDFNGDGRQDLATANVNSNDVTVLLGAALVVNNPPAGTDETVTTDEDTPYTFATSDFGFTDPDDSPANSFTGVTITTLPQTGTLKLDGTPATAGQSVSAAEIDNNELSYEPAADGCGSGYASFTFQVTDDGTPPATDQSANTMTIDVSCVDDDPSAVDDSKTLEEDAAATTIDVLANDSDPDGGHIAIDSATNGTHGTVEVTNSGADLTYTPDPDYCGADSFTYTLEGGSSATVEITVNCVDDTPTDTNPPETTIRKKTAVTAGPQNASQKRRVKFKFFSDESDASFECMLKRRGSEEPAAEFTPCESPKRYRGLDPGRYKFKVRAIDAAGNTDPTPAAFRFKISG